MLRVTDDHLLAHNPAARMTMYRYGLNGESYAICKTSTLIKAQAALQLRPSLTLRRDRR
jgi:type I restriction enzyme M protein